MMTSAVMAGVFFVFSSFVIPALASLQAAEGIRAMQRINVDVFSWSFSLLFLGTPAACIVIGINAIINWSHPATIYYFCGTLVYLLGLMLVTGKGNVPLNHALARVDSDSPEGVAMWKHYLVHWTRWNSLRALAGLISSILFAIGLLLSNATDSIT
jgi:uncharacterized membrane protein